MTVVLAVLIALGALWWLSRRRRGAAAVVREATQLLTDAPRRPRGPGRATGSDRGGF